MNIFRDSAVFAESALGARSSRPAVATGVEDSPDHARLFRGGELWSLALGRLTEVSGAGGGGGLTLAASFVRRVQALGRNALWLTSECKPFYPPDMEATGVALERLPLLFLPRPADASLVASRLLASGGFDLLVWDLASWKSPPSRLPVALLARLSATARHHRCVVLILTEKDEGDASLGCLIGLRIGVEARQGHPDLLEVRVVKDKRGSVGEGKAWTWRCDVPYGLPPSAPPPRPTRLAV